jgi:hypothetical protein
MGVSEAKDRLEAINQELPTHRARSAQLVAVRATLEQQIEAAGRPSGTYEHVQLERRRAALRMLEDGIRYDDGLLPEFEPLTTGLDLSAIEKGDSRQFAVPGIRATADIIARLEDERAHLQAYLTEWPDAATMRPFRYVGPEYKHLHAGRHLEPGEVVGLTNAQAHSFRDRFEAVS